MGETAEDQERGDETETEALAEVRREKHRSLTRSESIRRSWERRRAEGKDKMSAEVRAKISATLKGRPKDLAWRANIGKSLRSTSEDEKQSRSVKTVTLACKHCGQLFEAFRSRPQYCADCVGQGGHRAVGRLKRYGITDLEFRALLESQRYRCSICEQPLSESTRSHKDRIAVDHDHQTGRVRGLLHVICNRWVGQVEAGLLTVDHVQRAVEYLYRGVRQNHVKAPEPPKTAEQRQHEERERIRREAMRPKPRR